MKLNLSRSQDEIERIVAEDLRAFRATEPKTLGEALLRAETSSEARDIIHRRGKWAHLPAVSRRDVPEEI